MPSRHLDRVFKAQQLSFCWHVWSQGFSQGTHPRKFLMTSSFLAPLVYKSSVCSSKAVDFYTVYSQPRVIYLGMAAWWMWLHYISLHLFFHLSFTGKLLRLLQRGRRSCINELKIPQQLLLQQEDQQKGRREQNFLHHCHPGWPAILPSLPATGTVEYELKSNIKIWLLNRQLRQSASSEKFFLPYKIMP